MGKPTSFKEIPREMPKRRPVELRVLDWNEIYLDFGDKFLQPDGTLTKEIMPDFLHPSAKGYQIWADAIQPVIDQFFPPASVP